jgi:hypothetical protein
MNGRLNGEAYVAAILAMDGGDKPSEHGRVFGAALAKMADDIAANHSEIPERCKTCAFREGTIPNQMAGTLMQALNCVTGADPDDFACHHSLDAAGRPTRLCNGYLLLAMLATPEQLVAALTPALKAFEEPQPTGAGE